MNKDYRIVKEDVTYQLVDIFGNILTGNPIYRYFLKNNEGKIISHDYFGIFDLDNDYLAVCELSEEVEYLSNHEFDGLIREQESKTKFKLKWGVVHLSRDSKGNIEYQKEKLIIPYIYDGIGECNLNTIIACNNDKFTYIDLDVNSEYYGKELVPCILDYVMPFSKVYENFAECSVDEVTGFLPRNMRKMKKLDGLDLLTEGQTFYLDKYLNKGEDINLESTVINSYEKLTGITIEKGKTKTLKK